MMKTVRRRVETIDPYRPGRVILGRAAAMLLVSPALLQVVTNPKHELETPKYMAAALPGMTLQPLYIIYEYGSDPGGFTFSFRCVCHQLLYITVGTGREANSCSKRRQY